MNFPKYWAMGKHRGFRCWRWSDSSMSEAVESARAAAFNLAERFAAGERFKHGYGYPNRPMREQVLREIQGADGRLVAAITRNSYGALILNSTRVMFVDVDFPEPEPREGWFRSLFQKPPPPMPSPLEHAALASAASWTQRMPEWGWRIYRTKAGLRLMATHDVFEPDHPLTAQAFESLGADPLYRRLCRSQKCFRARLTPKPWRCEFTRPAYRWPWESRRAERRFESWLSYYEKAARGYATCQFISTQGNQKVHPEVQSILNLHDETTRAASRLKLA